MNALDLRPEANWRKRFRATDIVWAIVAEQNPERGLACTNKDGVYQLYAWDIPTGTLRQVTNQPAGVMVGRISSDGNHIQFLKDQDGNEIGHFVNVPFTGGDPEDISPDLPPYSSFWIRQNRLGNLTGFMANGPDGFKVYVIADGSTPKLFYQSESICFGPSFSCDGKIAVIESSERTKNLDVSLLALDTETGQLIRELWEKNTSIEGAIFSPVLGDPRLVCTSSASGFERPLIWNVLTGECIPLPLDDIPGSIQPHAWSDDAEQILLCQVYQAQFQLYRYEVRTNMAVKLAHPVGTLGFWTGGYFAPNGEIWVVWEDSSHPPRLIALDAETGALKREVLKAGELPEGKAYQSVILSSENGDTIQGWLALPDGQGPFPTISAMPPAHNSGRRPSACRVRKPP